MNGLLFDEKKPDFTLGEEKRDTGLLNKPKLATKTTFDIPLPDGEKDTRKNNDLPSFAKPIDIKAQFSAVSRDEKTAVKNQKIAVKIVDNKIKEIKRDPDKWFEKMSRGEILGEVAFQLAHSLDWGTTRDITERYGPKANRHTRDDYYELNPFPSLLFGGEPGYDDHNHPKTSSVDKWFLATSLAHALITKALPPKYRKYWLAGTTMGSGGLAAHNMSMGLKLRY